MKKAILLASATFLFAVYSQAQVQRPVSPTQQVQSDPAGHGKMKNELNLSKDQKVQMKALHQENKQQMEAIKNDASLTPDQKKEKMKELPVTSTNGVQQRADNVQSAPVMPNIHGFALFSLIAALMLTLLLEALDQTIVGTALPQIIAQFQGFDRYTWVGTAYLLASITIIPITGKLSDQFGRKWFFICGVIIFLLGSFLSGASQNMNQLITFRAIGNGFELDATPLERLN